MRLVISYTIGDECTYSCDIVLPFEYESAEKLLLDLESEVQRLLAAKRNAAKDWSAFHEKYEGFRPMDEAKQQEWHDDLVMYQDKWRDACDTRNYVITSGHVQLRADHFIVRDEFVAPEIQTVDEWFKGMGMT